MKRRWSRVFFGGLFLLGIISIVIIVIPFFLNPTYFKQMTFKYMQRTLGPNISVGQTYLSLWPYPHVEVSEVIVKEHPDTHAFFRAKHISLDLKILSLLSQEFAVKKLFIDQPELEIKRNRDGEWWIFRTEQHTSNDSFWAGLFLIEKVVVSDGRLIFIDESPREEVRGVVIEAVNLSFVSLESNLSSIAVEVSGRIRQASTASSFLWDGMVSLTPENLSQTDESVADLNQVVKMNGQIKVQNLDVGQVAEFFSVQPASVEDLGLADIDGQMTLMPGRVGYELNMPELKIDGHMGSVAGSANVSGLTSDDLTMFASFQSSPVSLKKIKPFIPEEKLPPTLFSAWKQAEIGGRIQVIQATVAGSTRSDVGMSIVGTFQLDQSFWRHKTREPVLKNISGEIVVEPDRIRLTNFRGLYDSLPVQSADGLIIFKESGPWVEVGLQSKISANQIVEVLTRISPSKRTPLFFKKFSALEGVGDVRLQFAGLLGDDEGVAFKSGEYVAQGLTVQVTELEDPVFISKGKVFFSPIEVEFDDVHGNIGESVFRLHGSIDIDKRPIFNQLTIQATLKENLWKREVSESSDFHHVGIQGVVLLQAVVSGLVDSPELRGEFDLHDSALDWSGVIKKPRGVDGSFHFNVETDENGHVTVNRAELAILPFRLSVRAKVRIDPTFQIHARVNTGPINLGLLPPGVIVGTQILDAGILEVSLDIRGRGLNWTQWNPKGWIALTEGAINVNDPRTPVSNLFLRLKVTPTFAEVKRLELNIQNSDVHLTGTVKNWKKKPEIDIVLESSNFDFDLLIPDESGSFLRNWFADLAGVSTVMGNIHIAQPTYKKLKGKNFSSILKIRDGLVTLDRIRGQAYRQPIAGRIFIHLPKERPAAIRSSFHVKGLPLEKIQQSIGHEKRLVTGQLSVRGMIQGHGRDSRGVVSTLNGNMDVLIEHGHVRKGTVIPRILALLNLPAILGKKVNLKHDGFPFNKTTATVKFEDGVMTSNDVVVDSSIMKMTSAGNYDMVTDQLDFVAAVSPFGRYSDFLKKIPLFGRILAGDRKGIATAMFQVQGSLTDPDIRYMPLKSFTTGLSGLSQLAFDVLKNTIMLPADMLTSDNDNTEKRSTP